MISPKLHYDRNAIENGPYFNLGTYTRVVTTKSEATQTWFDRGLIWSYAFNHEEAIRCFERANREDPNCCMALFGLAYALGPNYNKPWELFDSEERVQNLERAVLAIHAAQENSTRVLVQSTPVGRALINALQFRYPREIGGPETESYARWNEDYAAAMEKVYQEFGEDPDVAALYSDSLMNVTPWALWDIRTGEPAPGSRTMEAQAVLDRAIARQGGREHPGLLHLYIHLMEMSGKPELALPVADHLRGLVPDAGHLHHMPAHLDVLCGNWQKSINANSDAISADERYLARAGALNFYSLYRSHNFHFKIYSAMFAGKFQTAIETVTRLEDSIPAELLRVESPPMADWLESFLSMRIHVLIRFGKWDELLQISLPEDQDVYRVTTTMMMYGKAVAYAALTQIEKAEQQQQLFAAARARVPLSRTLFNNTALDILAVASAMLDGEVAYRRQNVEGAFQNLRTAIQLSDNLPYDEPWGWMQPPRHAYGALLLEQGRVEEASAVYKADLGLDDTLPQALRHPKNIWALHGLNECFTRLDCRTLEALNVGRELERCQAAADIAVTSSCFCRLKLDGGK